MPGSPPHAATIALLLAALAPAALAGDLDPPAGAIGPTLKDLVEVEPRTIINADNTPGDADSVFRIASSGTYYLISNITVITAETCIEIAADNVSIDLNGFTIRAIGAGTVDGISAVVGSRNVRIRNGIIQGFGRAGIHLAASQGCRIENMQVADCGQTGILVIGDSSVITDTSARNNGLAGIVASGGSAVARCTAALNATVGISVAGGSTVTACAAFQNTSGIQTGSGSVVSRCSLWNNSAEGIMTLDGCVVESCASLSNDQHGIVVRSDCVVRGNDCTLNGVGGGGAGIIATGLRNRIEANHCSQNERGIDVDGTANVITGNTCASSTVANYDINPDNRYGPILDISAAGTPGVTGSAGAGTMTTADPWANFSH